MPEMKVVRDQKGNVANVYITDASFYYTNIRRPRPIYDDRKLAYEKARKEYSVEVAVTEDIADEWDELFPKQPSKKLTRVKFMEKFKIEDEADLPSDDKKFWTLKVVQKAEKKDGTPINDKMIPRVFTVVDKKAKDITFVSNVGNGSKGDLKVRVNSNDYGTFCYLDMLKITDLIEYEDGGGVSKDDLDFLGVDDVELAEVPEAAERVASEEGEGSSDEPKDAPFDSDIDDDDF